MPALFVEILFAIDYLRCSSVNINDVGLSTRGPLGPLFCLIVICGRFAIVGEFRVVDNEIKPPKFGLCLYMHVSHSSSVSMKIRNVPKSMEVPQHVYNTSSVIC